MVVNRVTGFDSLGLTIQPPGNRHPCVAALERVLDGEFGHLCVLDHGREHGATVITPLSLCEIIFLAKPQGDIAEMVIAADRGGGFRLSIQLRLPLLGRALLACLFTFLLALTTLLLFLEARFFLTLFLFLGLFQFLSFFLSLCLGAARFLFTTLLGTQLAALGVTPLSIQLALLLLTDDRFRLRLLDAKRFNFLFSAGFIVNDNRLAVTRAAARSPVFLNRTGFRFVGLLAFFAQRLEIVGCLGHTHIVGAVVKRLALDAEAELVFLETEVPPVGSCCDMPLAHGLDVIIAGHQAVNHVAHLLAVQPLWGIQEI